MCSKRLCVLQIYLCYKVASLLNIVLLNHLSIPEAFAVDNQGVGVDLHDTLVDHTLDHHNLVHHNKDACMSHCF